MDSRAAAELYGTPRLGACPRAAASIQDEHTTKEAAAARRMELERLAQREAAFPTGTVAHASSALAARAAHAISETRPPGPAASCLTGRLAGPGVNSESTVLHRATMQ